MKKGGKIGVVPVLCTIFLALLPMAATVSNSAGGDDISSGDMSTTGYQDESTTPRDCNLLKQFSTEEQFRNFVNPTQYSYYYGGYAQPSSYTETTMTVSDTGGSSTDYTNTNIQVEGIDEGDIAKTDGEYIYTISMNDVVIVKAYPPEDMDIVSRLESTGKPLMLLLKNDRLIVFEDLIVPIGDPVCYAGTYYYCTWYDYDRYTFIKVYDISKPEKPKLIRNVQVSGAYLDSRLVDEHVYMFLSFEIRNRSGELTLPIIKNEKDSLKLRYSDIGHFDNATQRKLITMIVSLDISKGRHLGFFAAIYGWHSARYVSDNSVYLADQNYNWGASETTIHRMDIDNGNIHYYCTRVIRGTILNQFSMDEYLGNFRIATQRTSKGSNIYIFDGTFNPMGALEGIKPNETMYSVRFVRERAYLVTFRVIDPFFVIDLSNPTKPKILGELFIPGFSQYLHPYDNDHIISLGLENWGLKVSLFNVTDVQNPKEIAKFVVNGYSNSLALREHKAFTFHKPSGLLVIPVNYWKNNSIMFQGVQVFTMSLDAGISYKGEISHRDLSNSYYYWTYYSTKKPSYAILRSFYIEGYIYTVSKGMVKASGMGDLLAVAEVELEGQTNSVESGYEGISGLEPSIPINNLPQIETMIDGVALPDSTVEIRPSAGDKSSRYLPDESPNSILLIFALQFSAFGLIFYSLGNCRGWLKSRFKRPLTS